MLLVNFKVDKTVYNFKIRRKKSKTFKVNYSIFSIAGIRSNIYVLITKRDFGFNQLALK